MATTTNLLTWAEFERYPDDGMHHELIEGKHQILPPPKSGHSLIAVRALMALQPLKENKLGRVLPEAGYKLSSDPATWIQPDISILREERVKSTPSDGYFLGAPDLAIEVISSSESAVDVERKIDLLLAHGCQTIWVVYPNIRKIRVFSANGSEHHCSLNDHLTLPNLLPDFEFSVAKLFED
jgi:Uma2 family endonuclease